MVLLDWVVNNWYWALGGYALAVGVLAVVYAVGYIRAERKRLANLDGGTGPDVQSVANLNRQHDRTARAVLRRSGRRAIPDTDYWARSGGHVADGDSVLESEKAVA